MSGVHISESKRYYNVILSVHYFYVKTKMLADFQICISLPLSYMISQKCELRILQMVKKEFDIHTFNFYFGET